MTTYAWPTTPGWQASRFEMRVAPNVYTFTAPYSKTTQTVDFLGERWSVSMDLPANTDNVLGAAREAFFDRLRGQVNLISLWNLRLPVPQGTISCSPTVSGTVAQLANTMNVQASAGQTLRAGDHLGVGGQLVRVMADITADGSGLFTGVEFLPRSRAGFTSGAAITLNRPTANFMLTADGVPVSWRNGLFDASTFQLIEAY